ncbi:PAQR family membrane homeostasis protein TrhA [Lichenicola sp.]|uniref:PAQR family membrane homeostasis protein TrhA n=1 Tax=Lichenicola sp. TaxID=2804529 RepID=UPI003B0022A0
MIFPTYRRDELAADQVVHVVGLVSASAGLAWLLARSLPETDRAGALALLVYAIGLLCMLGASAAYNLWPPGRRKSALCLIDRSMIFVMIAGTYTPFVLHALPARLGVPLFIVIWTLALIGVALTLTWFERFQRVSLWLYLCMGWILVSVLPSLYGILSAPVLALLLGGGAIYSVGTVFHSWERLRFHNAIWHLLVLVAALVHMAAVMLIFTPGASIG